MLNAIKNRRSIRKYQDRPVSQDLIEQILQAGILAPSSKNRQPWRFVVVSGDAKAEMLEVMRQGLEREKQRPLLPDNAQYLPSAQHTWNIMQQAPAVIFILNVLGQNLAKPLTPEDKIAEICNAQSIGAAIQNMTLTATELGLGSLWICDIFFAYAEVRAWLNQPGEPAAALAIGYPAEQPPARPRLNLANVTEWRT